MASCSSSSLESVDHSSEPLTITAVTGINQIGNGQDGTVTVAALPATCTTAPGSQTNVWVWEDRTLGQARGLRWASNCGTDSTQTVAVALDALSLGTPIGWPASIPMTYFSEPHLLRLGMDNSNTNLVGLVSLVGPTRFGFPTNLAISIGTANGNGNVTWDNAHSYLIGDATSAGTNSGGPVKWSAVSEMHAGTGQTPTDFQFVPATSTRDVIVTWTYDNGSGAGIQSYTRLVSFNASTHVLRTQPVHQVPPLPAPPFSANIISHPSIMLGLADNLTQNSHPYVWLAWPEVAAAQTYDNTDCQVAAQRTRANNTVAMSWHSLISGDFGVTWSPYNATIDTPVFPDWEICVGGNEGLPNLGAPTNFWRNQIEAVLAYDPIAWRLVFAFNAPRPGDQWKGSGIDTFWYPVCFFGCMPAQPPTFTGQTPPNSTDPNRAQDQIMPTLVIDKGSVAQIAWTDTVDSPASVACAPQSSCNKFFSIRGANYVYSPSPMAPANTVPGGQLIAFQQYGFGNQNGNDLGKYNGSAITNGTAHTFALGFSTVAATAVCSPSCPPSFPGDVWLYQTAP